MDEPDLPKWPSFTLEEADTIRAVLLSNKVNYWSNVEGSKFEQEFAQLVGASYAVALANGTVALDVALKALGIGAGDEVVVTPRSFVASVFCVVNADAVPVFADVDRDSQNITAETIAAALTERTRAVIPVHLAGWPCDMEPIMRLAQTNGLAVIEDCAQAHGARYRNKSVGTIGNVGAWSFCNDKIMTTGGEGGMVTTDNRELWSRMWSYKDHGKSWEAANEREHPPGYRWLHNSFGTNWRMLEVQAAIGRIQIRSLEEWHRRRAANARRLINLLSDCRGLRIPVPPPDVEHAWYRLYAFVEPDILNSGWDRNRVLAEINSTGVPCYTGSCPEVYLEKAFDGTGWRPNERLPVARELGKTSLAFLVHPTLRERDIDNAADAIRGVMARAVG